MISNRNYNILQLYNLFTNEFSAFDFAFRMNLLYQSFNCRNCGSIVSIYTNNDQKFGLCFKCSKCKRFYSILYLSIFYHSKISINSVLYLIYCWSHKFQLFQAAHEVGVSENTVSFFYQQFRSACFDYLMDMENELIGGKNKIVEIDETLMCKHKYNRGRILNDVWILGGICREDGKVFAIVVKNRNAETLWEEIITHIAPGTIIMSDSWGAYTCIEKRGKKEFVHMTVNHSKNFVDPNTGANTQRIERLWRELKKINRRYEGIPRDSVQSHLAEFIWRRNEVGENEDPFMKAVELISQTSFE